MKKKAIATLLVSVLTASLCACGSSTTTQASSDDKSSATEDTAEPAATNETAESTSTTSSATGLSGHFSLFHFMEEDGERLAQMIVARHEHAEWQEVEVLDETERGAGGFGHTGKK